MLFVQKSNYCEVLFNTLTSAIHACQALSVMYCEMHEALQQVLLSRVLHLQSTASE